jgi:hypothetical protein
MPSIRLTLVACAGAALLFGGVAHAVHAQGSTGTDLASDVSTSTQSGEHATAGDIDTAAEQDVEDGAVADVEVQDEAQDTTDAAESAPATPEPTAEPAESTPSASPSPEPTAEPADKGDKADSADSKAETSPSPSPSAG